MADSVLAGSPGIDGVAGDLGGSSLELARLAHGKYEGGSTYPLEAADIDRLRTDGVDHLYIRVEDAEAYRE